VLQVRRIRPHERHGSVFVGHTYPAVVYSPTPMSAWYVNGHVETQKTNAGLQVLSELGTLYFEISPPRTVNANPFGDMMSSLFGGPPGSGPIAAQPRTITPGVDRAQLTLD